MDLIIQELRAILTDCVRANKFFTLYLCTIGIIALFCLVSAPATKIFWVSYIILIVVFIIVAKTRRNRVVIFDKLFGLLHLGTETLNNGYSENKGYKVPINQTEPVLTETPNIKQPVKPGGQSPSSTKNQTIPLPISTPSPQPTQLPSSRVRKSSGSIDKDLILELEKTLNKEILFQNQAVEAVVKAIKREVVGTEFKANKVQAFLMVGPTGTGKTKIAELTATTLKRYFTSYNMGAYKHDSQVQQFIGSPQGFTGGKGKLNEEVEQHPQSIILFDEIEKGAPAVLDFLLGVLDTGKLRDNRTNEEINFGGCKIFLTTNLIKEIDGTRGGEWLRENLEKQGFLRTEFLARVNVIPFAKFTDEQLEVIVQKNVKEYLKKVCEERGYKAKISADAKMLGVINKQINREFGARDVERILIKEIGDPLTESIFNLHSNAIIKEIYLGVNDSKIIPELKF